jgi:hypothetical protein
MAVYNSRSITFHSIIDAEWKESGTMLALLFASAVSDCSAHQIYPGVRQLLKFLSSFKTDSPFQFFGRESLLDFPKARDFEDFRGQIIDYLLGEFIPDLPILIVAAVAIVLLLSTTISICVCCQPRTSSAPSACSVISWIILSLIFVASLVSCVPVIAYAHTFPDFSRIPLLVDESVTEIRSFTAQFLGDLRQQFGETFVRFAAPAVLYPNLTIVEQFNVTLPGLVEAVRKTGIEFHPPTPPLHQNLTELEAAFQAMRSSIESWEFWVIGKSLRPILKPFLDFDWTFLLRLEDLLEDFQEVAIPRAAPRFATDHWYYENLAVLVYVFFALAIVLFVLQTMTFSMQNGFSRCFVVANNPISLVVAAAVGLVGVIATTVGVAMWRVCDEPDRFSAVYLSSKAQFQGIGLEPISRLAFSNPDENLYGTLHLGRFLNFTSRFGLVNIHDLAGIDKHSVTITSRIQKAIDDFNMTFSASKQSFVDYLHLFIVQTLTLRARRDVNGDASSRLTELENFVYELLGVVGTQIPQCILAARSMNDSQSSAQFIEILKTFTSNAQSLIEEPSTSLLCCPMRRIQQRFCRESGTMIGSFGIFAHFYLISLIGFTIVLLVRRRGMLTVRDPEGTGDRPRSAAVRTTSPPATEPPAFRSTVESQRPPPVPEADSDSSPSTSFDMYEQSRPGIL